MKNKPFHRTHNPKKIKKGVLGTPFLFWGKSGILDGVNWLALCDIPYGEEAGDSRNEYADCEHKNDLSYTEVEERNV